MPSVVGQMTEVNDRIGEGKTCKQYEFVNVCMKVNMVVLF